MLLKEYDETEVHELFKAEGERNGKQIIIQIIQRLVAGASTDELISEGFNQEDVDSAMKALAK